MRSGVCHRTVVTVASQKNILSCVLSQTVCVQVQPTQQPQQMIVASGRPRRAGAGKRRGESD